MKKHRLVGSMFYLAGPMDDVEDRGKIWRNHIKSWLWDMGIGVLCPFDKPMMYSENEDDQWHNEIAFLKFSGRYQLAHDKMRSVAADDYRMVDKADALILYIDKEAHMCGSYHENCMAAYQRKPVIVCCKQGVAEIPNWVFSVCRHEMFFDNWDSVKRYIKHIAFDKNIDSLNRWRFFDHHKIFKGKL